MPTQEPADPNGTPSIYVPFGGSERGFMFTDLAQLDRIIANWQTLRTGIAQDGLTIQGAAQLVKPPANDDPSVRQADAAKNSLFAGLAHNKSMIEYADYYLDRLQACRTQYSSDEQGNNDRFRNLDGD